VAVIYALSQPQEPTMLIILMLLLGCRHGLYPLLKSQAGGHPRCDMGFEGPGPSCPGNQRHGETPPLLFSA
jgi:hypothetical protein